MTVNQSDISGRIQSLTKSAGFGEMITSLTNTSNALNGLRSTVIKAVGENISGISGITSGLDNKSIAIFGQDMPDIGEKLLTEISTTDDDDLKAITGATNSFSKGFNDIIISSPTPEGIQNTLNKLIEDGIDITSTEVKNLVSKTLPQDFLGSLDDIANGNFASIANNLISTNNSFKSAINSLLTSGSELSNIINNPLQKVINTMDASLLDSLQKLQLPANELQKVYNSIKSGNKQRAIILILEYKLQQDLNLSDLSKLTTADLQAKGIDLAEIESIVNSIDTSIRNQITPSTRLEDNLPSRQPVNVETRANEWKGSLTEASAENFPYIETYEELFNDMKFGVSTREITQMNVFVVSVPKDTNYRAEDFHELSVLNKGDGAESHYYILENGSIQRGRPISIIPGTASDISTYSIEVSIVINENHSVRPIQGKVVGDFLAKAFYTLVPGGRLYSGRELFPNNVYYREFNLEAIRDRYNKINAGTSDVAYSTADLIAYVKDNITPANTVAADASTVKEVIPLGRQLSDPGVGYREFATDAAASLWAQTACKDVNNNGYKIKSLQSDISYWLICNEYGGGPFYSTSLEHFYNEGQPTLGPDIDHPAYRQTKYE